MWKREQGGNAGVRILLCVEWVGRGECQFVAMLLSRRDDLPAAPGRTTALTPLPPAIVARALRVDRCTAIDGRRRDLVVIIIGDDGRRAIGGLRRGWSIAVARRLAIGGRRS